MPLRLCVENPLQQTIKYTKHNYLNKIQSHLNKILGLTSSPTRRSYINNSQLNSFTLRGIAEYEIKGNWRSTDRIVDLLNLLRPSLTQPPLRQVPGQKPRIIVGDKLKSLDAFTAAHPGIDVFSDLINLSEDNQFIPSASF